ncbi:protein kinase [Nocardia sp. NPDC051832]|uniref:serine/threonine-protein kinase n=1 Tax=Nocardia sp. NPDC051832 TaxID=3155673 RepID=UPI003439EFE0
MLHAGEVFAGYVVKRVLGQGGMGTVYLAQHPRLPRLTALKLLDRELYSDDEIRQRFEREADLVAQLDHPNIVTVYDRGAEGDQLWISMQFVAGSDAASADVDAMAPARAVHIISDTAAALDFAHANGVLHRDVKPANILLAKAPIGQPERVLLTDFGIAAMRNADNTLSSLGQITATLAYAAPEQLSGTPMDHRADQYSLACTLFWMLTGAPPFAGGNPAVVMNGHLFGPVPSLRQARPGLPPALDGVLARALAKRPDDRFACCTDFAAAARQALASSGSHQHPRPQQPGSQQPGPHPGYPGAWPQTGYTPPAYPGYGSPPTGAYQGHPPQPSHPHTGYRPPGRPPMYPNPPGPPVYPPAATGYTSGGPPIPGVPPRTGVPPANGAPLNLYRPPGPGRPATPGVPPISGGQPISGGPPTSGPVPPPSGRNPVPPSGTDPPRPVDPPRSDPPRQVESPRTDPPSSSGNAAPQRPRSGTRRTVRPITIALPDAPIRRGRPPAGEQDHPP